MAKFPLHKAFLLQNQVLLEKFLTISKRLDVKIVKDAQFDRIGNLFVIFHDSFAEYFGDAVVILNGIPHENLIASFRRIIGDVIDAGACKSPNVWIIKLDWEPELV